MPEEVEASETVQPVVKITFEGDNFGSGYCLGHLTEEGLTKALNAFGLAFINTIQTIEQATVQTIVEGKSYYGELLISMTVNRGRLGSHSSVVIKEREVFPIEIGIEEIELYEIEED